jgi:hypothetical protein
MMAIRTFMGMSFLSAKVAGAGTNNKRELARFSNHTQGTGMIRKQLAPCDFRGIETCRLPQPDSP